MKKKIVLLGFILPLFIQIQAQSFKWAAQIGGIDYETGEDIAFDSSGNVYLLGIFNSTADFDPGTGTYNLTSEGAQDVYAVKLDSNKNFIRAVRVGGSHQDFAYSIAMKGNSVYIGGNFRDTADFDPGAGINNLVSSGGSDIFILKLDTALNFSWVKQIGGTGDDVTEKLTIDNAGNILIIGEFQNTVDFNPGGGVQNMTSNGSADAYVVKLDVSGNYVWSAQYGSGPGQFAYGIATDTADNIYITGGFYGTIDFDPGIGVYNLSTTGFNSNIYVLKWSSAGNFVWADNMGNSSGADWGTVIKTDAAGNPVITGTYFGTVDFDPGAGIFNLSAAGSNGDIFVLKLASTSGTLLFAKSMGGTGLDQPYGLALNTAGDIYVTGFFSLTADFDPGAAAFNLTAAGPGDVFILELDASGNFSWAGGLGGSDNDFGRGINTNGSEVYVSGVFSFTTDFDPGLPVYNLSSFSNSSDAFLLKLRFCTPEQTAINYDLCPGDSVLAGGAYQYTPGVYYDYYTAASGCDSIVTTTVQYAFTLNLGNDLVLCTGQSAVLDANVPGAAYVWSTGVTSQTITVSTGGSYWVAVTLSGCVQLDTINVTIQPPIFVTLGNDTSICITSSITLTPGPGYTCYAWPDGSSSPTFTLSGSLPIGAYTVTVTVCDSIGCPNSASVVVIIDPCTAVEETDVPGLPFTVYPNPFSEALIININQSAVGNLQFSNNKMEIKVYDVFGKEILSQTLTTANCKLPTANFSPGIYFIRVNDGKHIQRKKFLKE